ncbi:MAG: nicotinate-nucleotide--dimethylbenzimidazole phosphoribosyltransferase [Proteobacteria bacterium]|nr:nicotinate-nucleotide--dimethylbenzimidazole phosphoribosyltransferase [Pseudomonadota bacterium]MBU4275944.1 nicotinate-nucleotide--dimethylbenzimidazole phosphoribosyltransferase [Pseudomonadota bacterium]MBU4383979.1 nicotinate-nucleotide--dimethylbenzimidazole phosphoribosyltransferase [Pseudomonadota bacterium]MBU4604581.1 nicotinate-nucleotide--dimethylbenzimidazole phosphoribosyltransferase [Pseudomonadota bacterium]MCG2763619.1 nicotinate-nucleotide--dimethylbenzimidazole phosphoribo
MSTLEGIIERIKPLDPSAGEAAQARLDDLTKPLGSLGRLEELARRLAEIRGTAQLAQPLAAVAVFAADHGVAQAGVSPYPAEVTPQMVFNFLAGGAGINVLARHSGAQVRVVDVGVNYDFDDTPGLIKAKVAKGTANLMQEPAMTLEQARQAIAVGSQVAAQLIEEGHDLLIAGDMGIGNTTPCAALTSVLCGQPVAAVTGRGAGLDETGLVQKIKIIEQALALHQPSAERSLEALAAVGGLEIAAICGYILEAAAQGVPVILDGFIAGSGALVASRLCPAVKDYLFAGHCSVEIGHQVQLEALGLEPILNLNLRLGEGTGAALALNVLRAAVAIYNEMATFADAGVTGHQS